MGRNAHVGNPPFSVARDALGTELAEHRKLESAKLTTVEPQAPQDAEVRLPDPYEVVSVRSVPAPAGTTGASWHRYEISQGENRIVGYRPGAIDDVMAAIEAIVQRLNERRRHRRGRVQVVLQSRSTVMKPRSRMTE